MWLLRTADIKIKISITLTVVGQNGTDLLGVGTELKESIFKNRNQINSTVTTRTWVLPTEWTGTWPSAGLASE